jgi:DNA-binding MarR family transcriptional regulator
MENFCKIKELYKVVQQLEAAVEAAHGLSVSECLTMCNIKNGTHTAGELAENLTQSKSRISKILSGLEKKGLIKREFDQKDKRKTIFEFTDLGLAKAKEVEKSTVDFPEIEIKCTS